MQVCSVFDEIFADFPNLGVDRRACVSCGGPCLRALDVVIAGVELDPLPCLDEIMQGIVGGIVSLTQRFLAGAVQVDSGVLMAVSARTGRG